MVWVIFSVFTISHCQEAKAKTQPESGLFQRGLAGGSEGLVVEDAVVSPQWQPHSTSFILLCCVREELDKPFGIASHRDMHLSPKSRTVMQWSPPCSELAGLYCLSVCRWVRKSSQRLSLLHCAMWTRLPAGMGHILGLNAVVRFQKWGRLYQIFLFQSQNSCLINGWHMSQLGKCSWSYFVTLCVIKTLAYFFIKKRSWQTALNVCLRTK